MPELAAEVQNVWAEELAGLTAAQLREGWRLTKIKYPTWPPTPMEFRMLCDSQEGSELAKLWAAWHFRNLELQANAAHWDRQMQEYKNSTGEAERLMYENAKFCFNGDLKKIEAHYFGMPQEMSKEAPVSNSNKKELPSYQGGGFNATSAFPVRLTDGQKTGLEVIS